MENAVSMDLLPPGVAARILRLSTRGGMRQRLMDLGFVEGARVRCLMRSAAGDPTAFSVRGAVIALRAEDSRTVLVRQE